MTKIIIGLDENGKFVGHIPKPHKKARYSTAWRKCKQHLIQRGAVKFKPSILKEFIAYSADFELGEYQSYLKWQAAKGYRPTAAVNSTWSDQRSISLH